MGDGTREALRLLWAGPKALNKMLKGELDIVGDRQGLKQGS